MNKRLETELFKSIVEHTPLISIDLIIRNEDGKALLGQRLNRPAQNYWFVPGGRILKMSLSRTHSKELLLKNWVFKLALMKQNFLGFMNISTATIFLGLVFQLIMSYTDMRLV